ncbi:PEST proteolytic signal-containing nuclear protein-like [Amphibalanus amphitrite]|uniref:PEST proteolytic signal-containing nuclear protein-like n=1 Tax=Amphibalanus amphitrite TaxID=1232801 RepID=UPI001C910D57|nr:PEST proteolytic signal-containing nuclear protein-like [Amphibalanus amphitrite]XP_043217105.1 PEST proteolytic signal-containing nuclear protein-like [Amphibalanus amphitrite]XP_043217114.1 PEST proteolytic signal-containing nuclear protein-like [Amphibalanus amphitrite]
MSQSVKNPTGGGVAPKRSAADDREASSKARRTDADAPAPPPKISMSLGPKKPATGAVPPPKPPVKAISMKLGSKPPSSGPAPAALLKPKSLLAARAFGDGDSDDEEEEMPPEAKMRMKNIGRETPTSAGPNSFGKTKIGFCDSKKKRDRDLEESVADE